MASTFFKAPQGRGPAGSHTYTSSSQPQRATENHSPANPCTPGSSPNGAIKRQQTHSLIEYRNISSLSSAPNLVGAY